MVTLSALTRIYTTSEISVPVSEPELGRNQNNWIDVLCLLWSESMSEVIGLDVRVRARHVAISSDSDVRVRPRLCNAHAHSACYPALKVKNGRELGWPQIQASDVV